MGNDSDNDRAGNVESGSTTHDAPPQQAEHSCSGKAGSDSEGSKIGESQEECVEEGERLDEVSSETEAQAGAGRQTVTPSQKQDRDKVAQGNRETQDSARRRQDRDRRGKDPQKLA